MSITSSITAPGVVDPVLLQGPVSALHTQLTVTNIDPTATAVTVYANGTVLATATTPAALISAAASTCSPA